MPVEWVLDVAHAWRSEDTFVRLVFPSTFIQVVGIKPRYQACREKLTYLLSHLSRLMVKALV